MTIAIWKRSSMSALFGAALALGACSQEPEAPEPVEGVFPGVSVKDARLVLPPVSGNPAAIYFEIAFSGKRGIAISGAQIDGAERAELHKVTRFNLEATMAKVGPLNVKTGETLVFEPDGLHIMAFGLGESIKAGDTVEVTLEIAGGDTHKFDAQVQAAGDER